MLIGNYYKSNKGALSLLGVFFLCAFITSCNDDKVIYYNKPFEDIYSLATIHKSPFCVVLTDSVQNLSREYYQQIQNNYGYLADKAIFNIIDINSPENDWYMKWLCPVSIPLTCVFSADGTLIDLIPGAAKETFLYTEKALKDMIATDFHWPNQFRLNKRNAILQLNSILKCKRYLDQGIYSSSEFDGLTDSLNYPYAHYLRLKGALMENDTIASKETAKSMIDLENPYYLDIFKTEFITAKKVLNPDFDINYEPNIRVDHDKISLSGCELNKSTPVEIVVYNDGNQPLKISKIHTSCSCVKQIDGDNENFIVQAKESVVLKFEFTPDVKGEISRDIFITSNAINMPILHINILANV